MTLVPERRRHYPSRGMIPAPVFIFAGIEQQMLDQWLAEHALSGGARSRNRLMRFPATRVHDVDRRARHIGDHDGAVGGLALDQRRPRISVTFGTGDAAFEQGLLHSRHDVSVLG